MKGIRKPLVEFVGWRWAPTVGLLSAALLYVGIVVALVPEEIGGPVPPARTVPLTRAVPTPMAEPDLSTFSARTDEPAPQPIAHTPPPAPVSITPAGEFGRRGFTPPLERPAAPPEPVVAPPPPPPPPPVIPPPPPVEAPAVAVAPQGALQRGLVGAAFNAARRVAGQVEANVTGNTGNVAPVPGHPGAAPEPPPGAPGAPPEAPGAPPPEAPAAPSAPAPPVPVQ